MPITTEVRTPGIERMKRTLSQRLAEKVMDAWEVIYRAFIRDRFERFSRGAGNWRAIKPSTAARKGSTLILRDTDRLFRDLSPLRDNSGALQIRRRSFRMTAFLGAGRSYPSGVTTGEVASFHNEGDDRLPQRRIVVQPDSPTLSSMSRKGKEIVVGALRDKGAA